MKKAISHFEPILLFDGVCNLCNGAVQFVLSHDKDSNVRFASLQSEFAQRALQDYGYQGAHLSSIILLDQGKVFDRSSAVLRLCKYLSGIWPMLQVFAVIPKPVRDKIYDFIAARRYRWFGKSEHCMMPDSSVRSRFLDQI